MPGKPNAPKQDQALKRTRQGHLFPVVVAAEAPDTEVSPPELEPIQLLRELLEAFQSIPQRYCLICKGKIRLGLEGHKQSCPLRRAADLLNRK